jgi:hypothetical protein
VDAHPEHANTKQKNVEAIKHLHSPDFEIAFIASGLILQFSPYSPEKSRQETDNFFQAPNVVCDSRLHRWCHAQALMNPRKIVVHVMKGNSGFVVLNLL